MNRQRQLLAILAGLLALSLAYAYWAMPRQELAPPRAAAPIARPAAKSSAAVGSKAASTEKQAAGRLDLERLQGDAQPFPGATRDIFRFRGGWFPDVPVIAPPPVTMAPPPPPPPPSAEDQLRQALSGYRVIGFLESRGKRSLFMTSGSDVIVIRAGEPFGPGNRFVAREITANALVVSSADNSVTVRLPLEGDTLREPAIMAPVSVPRGAADTETPAFGGQPELPLRPQAGEGGEGAEPVPFGVQLERRLKSRAGIGAKGAEPMDAPQQGEGTPVFGNALRPLPSGEGE